MLKRLASLLLVSFVAACGGGGGSSGTTPFGSGSGSGTSGGTSTGTGSSVAAASLALSISSTTITTSTPATVTAVVKDSTGAGVPGQVVKFSTVSGLGVFTVNSALTDASGAASVGLSAVGASASGADQVVATTTLNSVALQATQGFQLSAASASIASFVADASVLAAYGQTNLTATVAGAPTGATVNLAVTSDCVSKGKATLTPATTSTTTGVATFTYRDGGCGAISAADSLQASIVGTSATKALALTLTSPTVSSVTFTSATPQTIYLKGSGLTETSTVVFTVVDTAGNGLPNQSVVLQPTTLSGGLTIDGGTGPVTKLSDSLGHIAVLINSGTVPTPVGVKATLSGATTVSSALSIAVGLPSQLNFSLSQQTKNIEGYDIDGTSNTYSIIASDRLANPVPVGTSINFIAEGGQIEPIKTTALLNGLARTSANYVSASPRPLDGRVTVLAYTLGEESFLDTNGDNVFTSGEAFQDLGSVFLSRKFLNTYFQATDQLIPLALPGATMSTACFSITSSLLSLDASIPTVGNGDNPPGTYTCDGVWGRAYVRRAIETVLSTSTARPLWNSPPASLYSMTAASCPKAQDVTTDPSLSQSLIIGYSEGTGAEVRAGTLYKLGSSTVLYGMSKTSVFSILLADNNPVRLNPVAAGSTISVSSTAGVTASIEGGSPVPSSLAATFVAASVTFDPNTATSGTVTFHITAPSGLVTDISQGVSMDAPPAGLVACP